MNGPWDEVTDHRLFQRKKTMQDTIAHAWAKKKQEKTS